MPYRHQHVPRLAIRSARAVPHGLVHSQQPHLPIPQHPFPHPGHPLVDVKLHRHRGKLCSARSALSVRTVTRPGKVNAPKWDATCTGGPWMARPLRSSLVRGSRRQARERKLRVLWFDHPAFITT